MKHLFYILTFFGIMACSGSEKYVVTNIQDLTSYPEGSSVFALPRTRIGISIQAVSEKVVPGPYCDYAEQLLGIEHAPVEASESWQITDVGIYSLMEPDPEYYFSLSSPNGMYGWDELEKLQAEGYILSPLDLAHFDHFTVHGSRYNEPVRFTDLSVKPYVKKVDKQGTPSGSATQVPVDMPVIRANDRGEAVKQKAEEAARFIIKIRKRRFKLLAGQYEVFPEGQALETSVRELNRLEEAYLSLFVGTTYRDTLTRTFYFTPGNNPEIEREELCRFSEQTGFIMNGGNTGRPIVLDMRNMKYTASFRHIALPHHDPGYDNTLLYRIPDKASIKIWEGSRAICEGEVPVYQYGAVVPMKLGEERPGK